MVRGMITQLVGLVLAAIVYPTGWAYVEEEGVDTEPGAYHDAQSDAFIHSQIGFPRLHEAWADAALREPGAASKTSRLGVFQVLSVTNASKEKACERRTLKLTDESRPDIAWSLQVTACGKLQTQRADAMMEWLARQGWPAKERAPSVAPTEAAIRSLKIGASWSEVRRTLGPSGRVDRGSSGGFIVGYEVHRDEVLLTFNPTQRLVAINRRQR